MLDARLSTLTFATKKTCFKRTGRDFSTCWPSRSNGTRRATLHLSRLPFCLDICKKPNRSTRVLSARGWLIQFFKSGVSYLSGKIEDALTAPTPQPATPPPISNLAKHLTHELFTPLSRLARSKNP